MHATSCAVPSSPLCYLERKAVCWVVVRPVPGVWHDRERSAGADHRVDGPSHAGTPCPPSLPPLGQFLCLELRLITEMRKYRTQFPHHPSSYHIHLCIHALMLAPAPPCPTPKLPRAPGLPDPPGPEEATRTRNGRKGIWEGGSRTHTHTHNISRETPLARGPGEEGGKQHIRLVHQVRAHRIVTPSMAIPKRASLSRSQCIAAAQRE